MRRSMGWLLAGACLMSVVALTATAKEKEQPKAPIAAVPKAQPAPAKDEKIAYKFSDQTKVDEFAKLWQQRQATVLRMTVLRSYFQEEQAALEKLNTQFTKDYNLDVTKNYRFDNEHKEIVELAEPLPEAAQAPKAP